MVTTWTQEVLTSNTRQTVVSLTSSRDSSSTTGLKNASANNTFGYFISSMAILKATCVARWAYSLATKNCATLKVNPFGLT